MIGKIGSSHNITKGNDQMNLQDMSSNWVLAQDPEVQSSVHSFEDFAI
jgi:hypothetical protein